MTSVELRSVVFTRRGGHGGSAVTHWVLWIKQLLWRHNLYLNGLWWWINISVWATSVFITQFSYVTKMLHIPNYSAKSSQNLPLQCSNGRSIRDKDMTLTCCRYYYLTLTYYLDLTPTLHLTFLGKSQESVCRLKRRPFGQVKLWDTMPRGPPARHQKYLLHSLGWG